MMRAAAGVVAALSAGWRGLRTLSGDNAYERYCVHHRATHPEQPLLSRKAFYVDEQRRKWGTINRCC